MLKTCKNIELKVEINNVQKAKIIKNPEVTPETQLSISQLLPGRSQDSKLSSVSCWLKEWRYSEVLATKHLLLKFPAKERKKQFMYWGKRKIRRIVQNSVLHHKYMLFIALQSLQCLKVFYREEKRMEQLG